MKVNKYVNLTAVLLLVVTAAASAAASAAPTKPENKGTIPREGLVGRWNFDSIGGKTAADLSEKEHDGAIQGDPARAAGVVGKCLQCDGRDDRIEIADDASLEFPRATFSVAAWINPYRVGGGQQMIVAKNCYSNNARQWSLMVDADRHVRFYLHHDNWQTVASRTVPKPGAWYHVAVTVDHGNARLYVNGVCEAGKKLGPTVADTPAPVTIGGVNNGGRLMQLFTGAIDEVCLYNRALTENEVQGMFFEVTDKHQVPEQLSRRFKLWDGDVIPKAAECPLLEGVEFIVVKPREPEKDGYRWLHGAAVCRHKGKLYASFGHNKGKENTPTELARGRVSADGGKTWGKLFTIDDGDTSNPAISHGVFLSHGGTLWALQGGFHDRMQKVHTRAYVLDEESGTWQPKGVVAEEGFWPMQEPLAMDDGNWIMAGLSVGAGWGRPGNPAAVAISRGEDFTKWDVIIIPKPKGLRMWGESTVIVNGEEILNISRWGEPVALAAVSKDYGRTWTEMRESNLPMAASKPYAGTLSTGQQYLVCTTTADSGNRRSPLTIAVSRPGEKVFSKIYRIRDAVYNGPGKSSPKCRLLYPYAVEHEGRLYVVYSSDGGGGGNFFNSCELAIIPIESLRVK
ncbi:MAG: LamG-like jellyroll fold domain-containing protein [Planctomycetota bacterium]|nr:LamG-like jellyroll fold domain-containing protein [Planctomycetota bacterium]